MDLFYPLCCVLGKGMGTLLISVGKHSMKLGNDPIPSLHHNSLGRIGMVTPMKASFRHLDLKDIDPSPYQHRKIFDVNKLVSCHVSSVG